MSIVQLSMFFFVVAVSCDSFYIISKCFMFVNNFLFLFCCCEAVPHATALIEYHIPPSLSTAFLFVFAICFCNSFLFAVLSELSRLIRSEILQVFKIFARMTSACHSLVSVSISERMLSYHGFPELSMLFLYFAQFRIFRHFSTPVQSHFCE